MNHDYSKRDYLLPKGCKDLGDVLKVEALKRPKASRPLRTNEEVRQVLRRYVPELAAGTVEIVSMARNVGRRCLLVVRSHDPNVSAVKSFGIERGERLNALIAELGGEYPDVLLWHPSAEQLIECVFGDSDLHVVIDSSTSQAVVTVNTAIRKQLMNEMTGRLDTAHEEVAGLLSEVTGWKITFVEAENH